MAGDTGVVAMTFIKRTLGWICTLIVMAICWWFVYRDGQNRKAEARRDAQLDAKIEVFMGNTLECVGTGPEVLKLLETNMELRISLNQCMSGREVTGE